MKDEAHERRMAGRKRAVAAIALAVTLGATCGSSTSAAASVTLSGGGGVGVGTGDVGTGESWSWPIEGLIQITSPYRQPDSDYTAGHRGIDLLAAGTSLALAPADGTIAFVGVVVDRPLVTIAHSSGLVSTLEP